MRAAALLVLIFSSQMVCFGQPDKIEEFTQTLRNSKFTNDVSLLKKAFRESHKLYLRHYKAYSETADIFKSGDFDCLSGTLFFTSVLDNLGFDYQVYETNYHIFLIANTSKGEVLIETTDKNNGFVKDKNEIEERLNQYRLNISVSPSMYLSQIKIFNQITREQMNGLVLFNKAVSNFLQKDFSACYCFLKESKGIYDTPRISEFSKILVQQIAVSNIDDSLKDDLISKVKSLNDEKISLASR